MAKEETMKGLYFKVDDETAERWKRAMEKAPHGVGSRMFRFFLLQSLEKMEGGKREPSNA